jgi:DNA-binding MarR family transcriptional regulator
VGRASAVAATGDGDRGARWLTSQEHAAWIELRRLLLLLPSALDACAVRQSGLSFFEYQIIATLSDRADRAQRMSELAEATSSSLSRLSHAVSRLEGEGFVVRRRCGGVGRSSVATLTAKGYRKLVASAPDHVESVRTLVMDGLTKGQLESLETIARQIAQRLVANNPVALRARSSRGDA